MSEPVIFNLRAVLAALSQPLSARRTPAEITLRQDPMSQELMDRLVTLSKIEKAGEPALVAASILRRIGSKDNAPARLVGICKSLESLPDEAQAQVVGLIENIVAIQVPASTPEAATA